MSGSDKNFVLICGSRSFKPKDFLYDTLASLYPKGAVMVHGACPTGADALAGQWAEEFSVVVKTFPAQWSKGKKAGPMRNEEMVGLRPVLALCFYDGDGKNIGTTDTTKRLLKAGYRTVKSLWRGRDFVLIMRPE